MEVRDFLATLYQGWSKTTDAETAYWNIEPVVNVPGRHKIYAVTVDPETHEESKTLVATYLSEDDAAFITAIHGSFGDVYRRVLEAFDEADNLDEELDKQIVNYADALEENEMLLKTIARLEKDNDRLKCDAVQWKTLWSENTDNAEKAIQERDDALAQLDRLETDLEKLDQDYLSAKADAEYWREQAGE